MPSSSRLPCLFIILGLSAWASQACAMSDAPKPKPKAKPAASAGKSDYPFSQEIPSAKAGDAESRPAVVEPPTVATADQTQAEVAPSTGACASSAHNNLQKTLLVTAFPRQIPHGSSPGDLADVDHLLPQLLSTQLATQHNAITPMQLATGLPGPALSSEQLLTQQTQQLARRQHTQLVLSGEVVDMSMANPSATYSPGLYRRFLNGVLDLIPMKTRFEKRERLFSFNVNLRDGFTGQSLFSKTYGTYGIWGETGKVGFGSPKFWGSDYGDQIKSLIGKAATEVGDVINCQPFIALVDNRPGQTQLLLQGGANNGLRAGDILTLYQLVVQGSENTYDQHNTRLVNRNTSIQLSEVYPSHSVGVISGTTYLTGQFLAVSP